MYVLNQMHDLLNKLIKIKYKLPNSCAKVVLPAAVAAVFIKPIPE